MRWRALCLALAGMAALPGRAAPPAAVVPDSIDQRLLACASCHAPRQAPADREFFPRISGKPAGYLYNQLLNFRDGRRQYPMMTYMVQNLPDAYLHEIAVYFAAQHPPAPAVVPALASADVLARGRTLALHGDAARKLPACVACHGAALAGTLPAVPGLLGLPRDYLNAQFGAWRNRTRRAAAPDCMATIAERLSLDDMNALSAWLASQPVDPAARPGTAISRPLPLECGSMAAP